MAINQTADVCSLPVGIRTALEDWFNRFDPQTAQRLSNGYQGCVWVFEHQGVRLVIKTVSDHGLGKNLLRFTLKHEYRIYKKLRGFAAAPRCYGLFRNRFLVLEYIEGESLRDVAPRDPVLFYQRFFDTLQDLHKRNIAHMDLKRKNNILVVNGCEPCLIDFGVAIFKKPGFHVLNNALFYIARRFDYNAWIKHKYNRRYERVSEEDKTYLRRTVFEKFARFVKQNTRRMLSRLRGA